jgi:hypothetical protein
MRRIGVAAFVGVALCFAAAAHSADVAGKWASEFDTQVGVQKYVFDFKVEGEKVSGKASFERMGQKGEVELKDGKLVGDAISFVEMLDFQGTSITITYKGKVAGNEMKLTRQVGDFATEEIVARRVKD